MREKPGFEAGGQEKYTRKQINHVLDLLKDYLYRQVSEMMGISLFALLRAHKATITQE